MKLSEAIRKGAKLRPQAFGYFAQVNDDGVRCSCAAGAAYEAYTGKEPPTLKESEKHEGREANIIITTLMKYSGLGTDAQWPDRKDGAPYYFWTHFISLNDVYRLDREAIADRLEDLGL